MPRDLPWATPYPLPRDTSEALMAEGRCENFGLLMERYLAFGSNRGQLELLRELTNRSALVPDFTTQGVVFEAYSARWRGLAEDMNAITFSAHPHWRVIVGLGTNDLLDGGIVLHPIFGFPVIPATSLKGGEPRLRPMGSGAARRRARGLAGKRGRGRISMWRPCVPGRRPVTPPVSSLT